MNDNSIILQSKSHTKAVTTITAFGDNKIFCRTKIKSFRFPENLY